MRVKISMGNSKQGRIPSVSLPPVKSCRQCNLPCAGTCYAMRMYNQYDNVRKAYDSNWDFVNSDLVGYFTDIATFLETDTSLGFRWHVSGDIPNFQYFYYMVAIANLYPQKRFLAFTKQYEIVNEFCDEFGRDFIPENLNIVFSPWKGLDMPNPYNFPTAEFWEIELAEEWEDLEEYPIPELDYKQARCNGNCAYCLIHRINCYWTSRYYNGYTVNMLEHGTPKANAWKRKQKALHRV